MKVLALNAGSNSLKFEVVDQSDGGPGTRNEFGTSLLAGSIDDIGKSNASFSLLKDKKTSFKKSVKVNDHGIAAGMVLDWFEHGHAKTQGVQSLASIERIGHRIVHGGDELTKTTRITDALLARINHWKPLAPFHTASVQHVIDAVRSRMGDSTPMYAVFDTAFHEHLPDEAALYALPLKLAKQYRIRRYGFHGISHHYLALRYAALAKRPLTELKLITLHLEGGSSAAAIRNGRSVDTSMGLTPLEGLMMGTRCGDLDPAAVLYLMRVQGWTPDQVEFFLNKQCGLAGVSGVSADTRTLVKAIQDPSANLALQMFCYRVRKYIGAYLAVLGGADAIVFGGGIGEDTALVRERICEDLGWCGAILDENRNKQAIESLAKISAVDSAIAIWVIPTEEGLMMARETANAD
jgi:acetate kinase